MSAVKAYDLPPPGANVWWVSSPVVEGGFSAGPMPRAGKHPEWIPESTCHVFTRTWFDARAQICSTLGVCQDAVTVTLNEPVLTAKDGSNA